MNRLKNLFKKYKELILIILLGFVPLLWYGLGNNMLITSEDTGYSIDPVVLIKKRLFAWDSSVNLGVQQQANFGSILYYGSEAFFAYITGSVFLGQRFNTVLWFLIPMLVMYLVIKKIQAFKDKPYMAFFAALLFQFNHFQLHAWRVFWRTRFSTYTLLPLTLLFLTNYLEGRTNLIRTAIYFGLSVFLLNGGGSPPLFGANILLIAIIIIYYLLISIGHGFFIYLKRSLLFIVTATVSAALFSSFWLFPYISLAFSTFSQSLEAIGGINSQLGWTDQISQNAGILNLLRNVGLPFWNSSQKIPGLFLNNPLLILISFIWPLLTLISLVMVKKKEEKKYLVLVLIFLITGLIFTTGSHPPFRQFYLFMLYNIPGFIIFRSTLYKFGNLLWFAYAILIAFSFSSIIEKLKIDWSNHKKNLFRYKTFLPSTFLVLILFWNFPLVNNHFFSWSEYLSTMDQVPQYVLDFKNWLNGNGDYYSRTALLPDSNKSWRQEVYRWKYWSFGSQLLPISTNKTTLSNDATTGGFERQYLDELFELIKQNDPTWLTMARQLDIRYLLLRNDFYYDLDWLPNTQPFIYQDILDNSPKVEKIKTFGDWLVYMIKDTKPAEKITLSAKPVYYSTSDNNLSRLISLINESKGDSKDFIFIPYSGSLYKTIEGNLLLMPVPDNIYLPAETGNLDLPKISFMPNSLFYFLILNKEKKMLQKAGSDDALNDIYISLSLTRLAELDEFIQIGAGLKNLESVSARYLLLLENITGNLKKLIVKPKSEKQIVRTRQFLLEEQKLLTTWEKSTVNPNVKQTLAKNIRRLEEILVTIPVSKEQEAVLKGLSIPFFESEAIFLPDGYKWKIPQEGLYDIYLNNKSLLANSQSANLTIDDKHVTATISADKNSAWQYLGQIRMSEGEHTLNISADGINLSAMGQKDIVFQKAISKVGSIPSPDIEYRQINPTKYEVKITSVSEPFYLVLNEKFNPDWKVYHKDTIAGTGNAKANYLTKIKEGIQDNFLDTLFTKSLPEEAHLYANGYANAWLIDPSKYTRQQKFIAVIEYWPQRIFYLGVTVSIISIAGSLIYLIVSGLRNKSV